MFRTSIEYKANENPHGTNQYKLLRQFSSITLKERPEYMLLLLSTQEGISTIFLMFFCAYFVPNLSIKRQKIDKRSASSFPLHLICESSALYQPTPPIYTSKNCFPVLALLLLSSSSMLSSKLSSKFFLTYPSHQ